MYNLNNELPQGWEYKTLGDVCELVRGPFGGSLKKDIFVETGYKVYEQQHAINNDSTINKYFITKEKYIEMKRFQVKPHDILMSCSGTIGKMLIIPNIYDKGIINQALLKITANKEVLNNSFLIRSLTDIIGRYSHGSTLKNVISVKELKKIVIKLPPLTEQERITNILDKIHTLISNYKQELKEYDNLIRSQFYTLFGDPITNHKKHPVKKLNDIAIVKKGKIITQATSINGNIPVIAGGMTVAYSHNQSNITGESITVSGSGASAGYVWFHNYPIWASDCTVIQSPINMTYLYYVLLNLSSKITQMRQGSAQPHVYHKQIAQLDIIVPQLSEQEKFSTFTEKIQTLKHHTTQKLTQAQQLFNSTSQQAFKGNL